LANEIRGFDVSKFRGAIIKAAGRENILFHNHMEKGFRYKYPLIQYKQINKKPLILCLEEGVNEINHFFEKNSNPVKIGDKETELKIEKLFINQVVLQTWDKLFDYQIRNWIALNQENYIKYQNLNGLTEKSAFLENILKANILSFMKGMDFRTEKEIIVKLQKIKRETLADVMKIKMQVFDIEFKSNVFIPEYIGLGKSVSKGYGIVEKLRVKKEEE